MTSGPSRDSEERSINQDSAATASPRIRNKAELKVVFKEWVEQHGYIWFEGDLTLAASLVSYLGIEGFKIDGVAVTGGDDDDAE